MNACQIFERELDRAAVGEPVDRGALERHAAGCREWRVIFLHVAPNTLATYIVLVTVNIAYAIVVEASLSFLGLGAPPDEPSWGSMLTAGTQSLETAPWMIFFPGLAISLTVLGLNLFGDAIRDLTDPRLRGGLG